MRLAAYYDILNEQPDFVEALEQLRAELLPWLLRDDESVSEWDQRLRRSDDATGARRGELVDAFVKQWGLPRWRGERTERRYRLNKDRGASDVLDCLNSRSRGQPLRLRADLMFWRQRIVSTVATTTSDTSTFSEEFPPRIHPLQPEPFVYDPFDRSRAWVRREAARIAEEVRQSVVQQAEILEQQFQQHGARPLGVRHQDPVEMRRMALRLYRRAVRNLRWEEIADVEMTEDPDAEPDAQTIRRTVTNWARVLDIPLPKQEQSRRRKPES
jgi:hypothetical protein